MASIPEFLTQALQAQYGETLAAQILAGYAWDRGNPYVAEARRLRVLEELCSG